MSFTLYSGPLSMFGAKVQIAALEKGIAFDLVMVPFEFTSGYAPKHPEVLRINPKRQVPVLVEGDLEIFDSTQCFEYLEDLKPDPPLWPRDRKLRARARKLELMADEVFFPQIVALMKLQGELQGDAAGASIAAAHDFYRQMDSQLASREWIADSYSCADIALYMAALFGQRLGAPIPAECERLIAWRDRMSRREAVREVVIPMAKWLQANGRPLPPFLQEMLAT